MAYLSKDPTGLIQLWNHKPEFRNGIYLAWIDKANCRNEVGLDVTSNEYFQGLFEVYEAPVAFDIELKVKILK